MPRTPPRSARRLLGAFFFFVLCFRFDTEDFSETCSFSNRRLRENHAVIAQQVIRMHLVAPQQLEPLNIARAQSQILILVLRLFDNQNRLIDLQRIQRLADSLVFGSFISNEFTTISLPSASFAASAERNAPISFLRGKV